MKNFALLNKKNFVINISIADENWDSTGWVEYIDQPCGIGYEFNKIENIFIAPQPYPSWIRVGSFWNAPIDYPIDGADYLWNEENQSWDLMND
jgi:hypothetical protein